MSDNDMLDWLANFHAHAIIAYAQICHEQKTDKPESDMVKHRAYKLYEDDLRNGQKSK